MKFGASKSAPFFSLHSLRFGCFCETFVKTNYVMAASVMKFGPKNVPKIPPSEGRRWRIIPLEPAAQPPQPPYVQSVGNLVAECVLKRGWHTRCPTSPPRPRPGSPTRNVAAYAPISPLSATHHDPLPPACAIPHPIALNPDSYLPRTPRESHKSLGPNCELFKPSDPKTTTINRVVVHPLNLPCAGRTMQFGNHGGVGRHAPTEH